MEIGGSNYIFINGEATTPTIGAYHLHPDVVASDLASMRQNGQQKITLVLWYAPVASDLVQHVCNSTGGTLSLQHRSNLVSLISAIRQAGYNELHLRFAPQSAARVAEWNGWEESQFNQNRDFILSTIRLVEANKGSLPVIYDLGLEHCNETWGTNPVQKRYCMSLWKAYLHAGLSPSLSCGFSAIHGDLGLEPFLLRLSQARLRYPGVYCCDVYGYEYRVLTTTVAAMARYGQQGKPVYLQEAFYNDATSCSEIKRAIRDTPTMNFKGVFQWPHARGTPRGQGIPDVYPKRFDNYLA